MKFYAIFATLFLGTAAFSLDKTSYVSINDFNDYEIKSGNVKLNNFSIGEERAWLVKGLVNLKVSFSAQNKNDSTRHFSTMMMGFDKDTKPLWSISLTPMMSTISANKTEIVKDDTYVSPNTLKATKNIWIRTVGDF